MSTPYAVYAREFTARLRARVHRQTLTEVYQRYEERAPTSAGTMAKARLKELQDLIQEHRRTFDPQLRQKGLGLLHTLPLQSTKEDPHFTYTFAALRSCSYFNAITSPLTFNLLNHVTRHTFLLDSVAMFQFTQVLAHLQHPQTAEVVQILLPRLKQLAGDFTATEARLVLEFLAHEKALDAEMSGKLAAVMQNAVADMSVLDLARCVKAVPLMSSQATARQFLQAASPRLCKVLHDSVTQRHCYASLYVPVRKERDENGDVTPSSSPPGVEEMFAEEAHSVRSNEVPHVSVDELQAFLLEEQNAVAFLLFELPKAIRHITWAPRRLLNELVRTTVAWSAPERLAAPSDTPTISPLPQEFTDKAILNALPDGTAAKEERRSFDDYMSKLPQLRRHHLSAVLKALHYTSYRHSAGLRLLSTRVAMMEEAAPAAEAKASLPVVRDSLAVSVEAVAYFYATDCLPAVVAMVGEIQAVQLPPYEARLAQQGIAAKAAPSSSSLTHEESVFAEAVVLRTVLSSARLLSACTTSSGEKAKEKTAGSGRALPVVDAAVKQELCVHTAALISSQLVQTYLRQAQALLCQPPRQSSTLPQRRFAGAVHVLYSIAVLFQTLQETDMVAPASNVLRGNLKDLVQLAQAVSERQPEALTSDVQRELRTGLQLVQRHPEWLDV